MRSFQQTLDARRVLIGMIHVGALPGSPGYAAGSARPAGAMQPLDAIVEQAIAEAHVYRDAGFHALMIENMHDRPYLKGAVGPEVVAAMTRVACEVRRAVPLPLGVQVLAAANTEAIAVAHASGAAFVRVEGFVFGHVADEGYIDGTAGALLRYRRAIGADDVLVLADVKKKHASHAVTADVDIAETARAAEFFLADGVIVTGPSTGQATDTAEVEVVSRAISIPVLVGSGITPQNIAEYPRAAGFIVGSWVKQDGRWSSPLDPARAEALSQAFRACASQ